VPDAGEVLVEVERAVLARGHSALTARAYVAWVRRLVRFHRGQHPKLLSPRQLTDFVNDVTVERHRGDLSIDVGSGGISVADVDATSVGIDTGSGSVTGRAIRADELLIDTGSGRVELNGTTARRTRVESGSGTVRVELLAPVETLDIATGSGGVTVRIPQALNASLSVSTGSGGIDTDFPVRVDRATRNSLRGTIGNGGGSVRIETGSGGVRLMRSSQ